MNKYKTRGWFNESQRHSLARKGIKTVTNSFNNGKKLALRNVKFALENDIFGVYTKLLVPSGPIIGYTKENDKADKPIYPEWEGTIDYQQVTFEPVTVQLPEEPQVIDISDTEKKHEREERIRQAGIKTRQAIVKTGRGVVHGVQKVGKGILGTIAEGIVWEPLEDEPRIEPGFMGMGREDSDYSKSGGWDEPDNPSGIVDYSRTKG